MRAVFVTYSLAAYTLFFFTFLYAIGFVGDFFVPKTIDSGQAAPLVTTLLVDVALLAIFAIQHSVMARPAFKAWWRKIVPPPAERATYVALASLALILLFWQWRPLPSPVWAVQAPLVTAAIRAVFWLGWATVLLSTFMIDHFDLFGLRQAWTYRRAGETPPADFRTPLFYRVVRHPIYLGFIIAFWAAPVMSIGHLIFAIGTTGYVLIAIQLEEHDLMAVFGDRYGDYRKRVAMIVPFMR